MQVRVTLLQDNKLELINMASLGIVDGKLVRGFQPLITKKGEQGFIYGRELKDIEICKYLHG